MPLVVALLALARPMIVAAAPCPIVDRGSPTDGVTTITVVEPPSACAGEPLFAGWFRTRLRSDANDNGVRYEIEVRWNRVGLPSRGSFTWLNGGPGKRSVRGTTNFGADLQDVLDREDAVRSIELTFQGAGLESWPRNGLPNLSALLADVWEWLVTVGIAEGVAGHFGSSSGSLLAANALAHHDLDRILDGVVFGGGPFWTNLRETCLDFESPTFGGGRIRTRIDRWNWEGAANPTPCTDRSPADPSYECRSLLGPGADADYPGLAVSVLVGEQDYFNPWLTAAATAYWQRIAARRKTLDRTDSGHCVLATRTSTDAVLRRIREILGDAQADLPVEAPSPGISLTALPNPTSGPSSIRFTTAKPGRVLLTVHDVRGALRETLLDGEMPPGPHEMTWAPCAGRCWPAGTYFIRCETANRVVTRKVTRVH